MPSNDGYLAIFGLKQSNIGEFEGHGLFVPDGTSAREIGVGAKALMREDCELNIYKAQALAATVLLAVMEDREKPAICETP